MNLFDYYKVGKRSKVGVAGIGESRAESVSKCELLVREE